jgi:hypothetical protein
MREPLSRIRYFSLFINLHFASNLCCFLIVGSKSKPKRRSGCPVSLSLERFGDRWSLLIILPPQDPQGLRHPQLRTKSRSSARGPLPPHRKRHRPRPGTSRNSDLGRTPRGRQRLLRHDQLSRNKSSLHSQRSSQAMVRPRYHPNFADLRRNRIRPQFRKEKIK